MVASPTLVNDAIGLDSMEGPFDGLLAWEVDSTPRLTESDLSDPAGFYRRLEDYLMNQK